MRRHPRPPMGIHGMGPPSLGGMRPPHRGPMGPPLRGPRPMGPRPLGLGHGVSSRTNSTDPASKDSRLFVGNLNTIAMTKEGVERIFNRYGLILGISMHKGYAFIQFNHPDEARRAGASEDGKCYAGQNIDINIVSQPKNRNAQKRPSSTARQVNDAPKKARPAEGPNTNQSLQRTLVTLSGNTDPSKRLAANNAVKRAIATATKRTGLYKSSTAGGQSTGPWPDVLICGVCKLQFSSLHSLAQHKKVPCGLKVSTQAGDQLTGEPAPDGEPSLLVCANCDAEFSTAWALCQHCTEEHSMTIYKTNCSQNSSEAEIKSESESTQQ